MQPIGNTGVVPSPTQGLNTLGSIIGLQQARQNLQTGQYIQSSAQSAATQAQQGAKETQAGAQLLSDPQGNGLIDENGNPTKDAYSIIKSKMPTTGDEKYQSLIKTAQGHVEFRNSVQNLSQNEQGYISSQLAGYAADPNAHIGDMTTRIDQLRQQFKGTPEEDSINKMLNVVKGAVDDAGDKHGMDGVRTVVNGFSRGALGNAGITGAGGVGLPAAATTGAGTVNRNPLTGGLSAPPGAPPGSAINPTPPQVAGQTVRQTGTGSADIDTSNTVVAAQRDARANIDLTKRIDQLADVINPGLAPDVAARLLAKTGLTSVSAAREEIDKDLSRIKGSLASRAQSDTRAGPILDQIPDATKQTDVIHNAMDLTRGFNRQDLALGKLREKTAGATGGQMNGFQGEYAHATGAASPLMHEYQSLQTPQEQASFLKRNFSSRSQAQAFRDQLEAVKKHSPNVLGQ